MNESSQPTVSVCIATYNQDRYIKDCLASVLAQLVDVPLEILVGDDGTDPDTPLIVGRLSERHPGVIHYFRHPENLGPAGNYQFLVARARGRYIAHLDGDDFWLPGKLAAQLEWLEAHPESLACYGSAVVVDERGAPAGVFSRPIHRTVDLSFLLAGGNFLNHSSMVYRTSHRHLVLDIPEPFIDYRLHLNFARHGVLGVIDRAMVVYRLGSVSSMIRTMPEKVHAMYFEALVSAMSDPAVSRATRRSALIHFWRTIVLSALLARDFGAMSRWTKKFKSAYPQDHFAVISAGSLWAGWRVVRAVVRRLMRMADAGNEIKVLYER
jgi:glycosyltransferase involved in cell wall biosynthesis